MQPPELETREATRPPVEESAWLSAKRMEFAANSLPALIAYLDDSVRYVWVNDGYSRWFGRQREEILGRHPSELLDPAAWAAIQPHTERALAGEKVTFDNVVLRDGATHDVRASQGRAGR